MSKAIQNSAAALPHTEVSTTAGTIRTALIVAGLGVLVVAPMFIYPIFLMKLLCFALFACAFNLLIGYTGLLSFGHAAFFGGAAYFTAYSVKEWGVTPEIGLVIGMAGAALLGLVIGFLPSGVRASTSP